MLTNLKDFSTFKSDVIFPFHVAQPLEKLESGGKIGEKEGT